MSDDTLHGHNPDDVDVPPPADSIIPPAPSRRGSPAADRSAWEAPPRDDGPTLPVDPEPAGPTGAAVPPAELDPEVYSSARAVIPRVLGLTGARAIVDIGCGSGAWVRACRDLGVPEVVGVDGPHLPDAQRRIATEFIELDLAEPLGLARRFNLVICVDVVDDLPPRRSEGLIADITTLAPAVLFAAAVPGQDATPHANEQWPEHWVAVFEDQGWTCRDAIRPWIRTNDQVSSRYRQTLFLAVAREADGAYQSLPRLDPTPGATPVDYLRRPAAPMPSPPASPIAGPPPPTSPPTGPTEHVGALHDDRSAGKTEAAHDASAHGAIRDDPAGDDAEPAQDAGAGGDTMAAEDTGDGSWHWSEDEHPKPPGWDALVRLGRRARRRKRDG